MQHRIRAAGLLLDAKQRILLVREVDHLTGVEFWVPPGGGLELQDGSVLECLVRELEEETGLKAIELGRLVYLREFSEKSRQIHHVELFFEVLEFQGEINSHPVSDTETANSLTRNAQWFSQEELMLVLVYPKELKQEFWLDYSADVKHCKYLGVQVENLRSPSDQGSISTTTPDSI